MAVHLHADDAAVGVEVDGSGEGWGFASGEERRVVHETKVAEGDGGDAVGIGAGVGDEGIAGPVEVGFAEPGLFGDEGGEGGWGLVEDVRLLVGGEGLVVGVDGGELPGLRGLDDGVPAEGIDGVGAGGDAENLCAVVVVGLGELEGFFVFGGAPGPESDDGCQGGDGPAASAIRCSACADLAVDKAEECGGDESDEEEEEDDGLEDEDEGAGVPARVKGEEWAEAVVVGPVEQEMA